MQAGFSEPKELIKVRTRAPSLYWKTRIFFIGVAIELLPDKDIDSHQDWDKDMAGDFCNRFIEKQKGSHVRLESAHF